MELTQKKQSWHILTSIFGILFFIIGILNAIFVHIVPGFIYIVISLIYLPQTDVFTKKRLGFMIPLAIKIVLGIMLLWATLGVGDLMEVFESKFL